MINKNIVITGGAGFIGSNICHKLCEENNLIVVDNLASGRIQNIKDLIDGEKITFYNKSINDLDFLKRTFNGVDYVLHLAAISSVPWSVDDPITTNKVNIDGTLNVLIAARENNVKKVVYASTSAAYGDTAVMPINESVATNPLSPYAISKLAAESYCKIFTDLYGLDTISLRYFNVYGPRQDPKSQYAAVVPIFMSNVKNNRQAVIYGDGEQTRGFTYVDDVVQANVKAMESKACGAYNISGREQTSINELARSISDLYGYDKGFSYESERPGDIIHSYADISKARNHIDYEPKYSLKMGLELTKEWYDKE